jgi:hypothetical protein
MSPSAVAGWRLLLLRRTYLKSTCVVPRLSSSTTKRTLSSTSSTTSTSNDASSSWSKPQTIPNDNDKSQSECIYLDYNGTTPIYPQVLESMMPYFTSHYGNPSSSHIFGNEPRCAIDHARRQLLTSLCVQAAPDTDDNADTADNDTPTPTPIDAIWFTGCGTESDNLAIALAVQTNKQTS